MLASGEGLGIRKIGLFNQALAWKMVMAVWK